MSSRFTLKDHFRESRLINGRLLVAALISILVFSVVIVRLVVLQVFEYEHFDSLSNRNRVDIEPLPPQRGLIPPRHAGTQQRRRPRRHWAWSTRHCSMQSATTRAT